MAAQLNWLIVGQFDRLASPQILARLCAMQAQLAQAQVEGVGGIASVAGIEDCDRQSSALQMPGLDFDFAIGVGAFALFA